MCLLCAWCEIYFHSLLIKRRFSWPIKFLLAAWTSIPNYHHQIFHCMQNHIKLNQQRTPNPCKVRQTREQHDCFVLHGRGDFDWLIEYRPKYKGQYWHTNCWIALFNMCVMCLILKVAAYVDRVLSTQPSTSTTAMKLVTWHSQWSMSNISSSKTISGDCWFLACCCWWAP